MDQEILAALAIDLEHLRISATEIAARIRTLGDVEIVVDEDQFDALEHGVCVRESTFSQWVNRF